MRPEIRTPPGTSLRTGTTPLINAGGKNAYRIGTHTTYRIALQIPIVVIGNNKLIVKLEFVE